MVAIRCLVLALLLGACVRPGDVGRRDAAVTAIQVATIADVRSSPTAETAQEAIVRIARSQVGTMEVGGNNCGPGPKKYLASVGLPEGYPYCAAGLYWCYREAGVRLPGGKGQYARAAHWSQDDLRLSSFDSARVADVCGYYYASLRRIGHVELFVSATPSQVRVIGFNTTNGISRDGEGVFEKIILRKQVTCVTRHIQ